MNLKKAIKDTKELGLKYVAVDKNKEIFAYYSKPIKYRDSWGRPYTPNGDFNGDFFF